MEPLPHQPVSARAERRAMIALVAVFALLVQALVPSLAGAAPIGPDVTAICTSHGLQVVPTGDAPPDPGGGHCDKCVCPPTAAPPPAPLAAGLVRLALVLDDRPADPTAAPPPARAPPRPFGQGPPAPNA